MPADPHTITVLLHAMRGGDVGAGDRLMRVVYDDLRAMAYRRMTSVPPSDTLTPTALVHETFLRLVDKHQIEGGDRRRFFAVAARAMHDIVVEQARRHAAQKRGGDRRRVPLEEAEVEAPHGGSDLLALSAAVRRLADEDALAAEVVMLRSFAELSHDEIADLLELPVIRVRREWQYAKAFLHRALEEQSASKIVCQEAFDTLLVLLHPIAPHMTEELWERRGHLGTLLETDWPEYDEDKLKLERVTMVVQIDGKLRDRIEVSAEAEEAEVRERALSGDKVRQHLEGREIAKAIVVPGRLINLVTRRAS